MDLFDSKRQERLEAATASKEAALAFLIRAGDAIGQVTNLPSLCLLAS